MSSILQNHTSNHRQSDGGIAGFILTQSCVLVISGTLRKADQYQGSHDGQCARFCKQSNHAMQKCSFCCCMEYDNGHYLPRASLAEQPCLAMRNLGSPSFYLPVAIWKFLSSQSGGSLVKPMLTCLAAHAGCLHMKIRVAGTRMLALDQAYTMAIRVLTSMQFHCCLVKSSKLMCRSRPPSLPLLYVM